jgi:hypothetical protein
MSSRHLAMTGLRGPNEAKKTGTSKRRVKKAVKKVGNSRRKVERQLRR